MTDMEKVEKIVRSFRRSKNWWTIQDFADFFEMTYRSAWNIVRRSEIQAVKRGGEWRIHVDWVIEYIKKNQTMNID